jgi:hypothetical protein
MSQQGRSIGAVLPALQKQTKEDRMSCQKCHREGEITGTWWGKQGPELIGFVCRACGEDWTIRIEDAEPWMLTAAGMADLRRARRGRGSWRDLLGVYATSGRGRIPVGMGGVG